MFRFTIRDVLWLTVVVAQSAGGWIISTGRIREAVRRMESLGFDPRMFLPEDRRRE